MIGEPAVEVMLNKSLFFISIGSNDIFSFFQRNDGTPPESFITNMLSAYSQYITVRALFTFHPHYNYPILLINQSPKWQTTSYLTLNWLMLDVIWAWSKKIRHHKRSTSRLLSIFKINPTEQHWHQWLLPSHEWFCSGFPLSPRWPFTQHQLTASGNEILSREHIQYDSRCYQRTKKRM